MRQELLAEQGIKLSLGTIERDVAPLRAPVDPLHLAGVVGFRSKTTVPLSTAADVPDPELLRPLLEHERLVGRR